MASCVNRYTRSFCHEGAQLPRAVWLRDIFGITFLAFIAELFHLGPEGMSCRNETFELELFLLQSFAIAMQLQLQCNCLSLLQPFTFTFLLPFSQVLALKLKLLHLNCDCLSQALPLWWLFLLLPFPFPQVFALLPLIWFFFLQALTFKCQLLHLHVKFIMFHLQICLGGCCLMPTTKNKLSKKHKSYTPTEGQNLFHLGSSHLFGLVFHSSHQNAHTSVQGSENRQILGSKAPPRSVRPPVPEPRRDLTKIPPFFSPLHGQLQVTDDLPKRTATCCQMLHGDVVQIHLSHFLVAGFVQKAEQVQHALRGGTVRLQGSEDFAPKRPRTHWPKWATILRGTLRPWLPAPSAPHTQDPRVCLGGPSVLVLDLTNFSSTSDALVGLWDNRKRFFRLGRLRPSEVPRNPLGAPNSLHSMPKKSLLSHHGRNCIQYSHANGTC